MSSGTKSNMKETGMKKTTATSTPPFVTNELGPMQANDATGNDDNTSKHDTAAKVEAIATLTSPMQTAFAVIENEHHDMKEANMGNNVAPTPTTTRESETDNSEKPNEEIDVIKQLRVPQDFGSKLGAKKRLTTVPIRKPNKHEFVRVHSTMEPMVVMTLEDERETFLGTSDIADSHPGQMVKKELVPAITRQGVLFLWPLRVPGEYGKTDNWLASAREAAAHAVHAWVRVQSNMSLGAYEVYEAIGAIPDPVWPDLSMDEIVRIAVRGRVINTIDHPVLRKLRGEI
jgi:hypothetical protein